MKIDWTCQKEEKKEKEELPIRFKDLESGEVFAFTDCPKLLRIRGFDEDDYFDPEDGDLYSSSSDSRVILYPDAKICPGKPISTRPSS